MRNIGKVLMIALIIVLGSSVTLNTQAADERSYDRMVEDWQFGSSTLQMIKIDLDTAERAYQGSLDAASQAGSSYSSTAARFKQMGMEIPDVMKFSVIMQRDLARIQAEQTWQMAKSSAELQELQSERALRNSYLNYMNAANNLEITRIRLEMAEINIQKQEIVFESEKIDEQAYLSQKLSYQETQASYQQAEYQLSLARIALNAYLDVPMDTIYQVDYQELKLEVGIFNIEYYLADMLEKNLVLKQYQDQLNILDFQIETYEEYGMDEDSEDNYNDLLDQQYEQALRYDNELAREEKEIREAVLDLRYQTSALRQEFSEHNDLLHNWEEAQVLYESGVINKTQLLSAELAYIQAYDAYYCAVYEYNTFIMEYEVIVTTGIDVPGVSSTMTSSMAATGGNR